mmetsp:Transcript_4976/g.15633  ORF Transcript_4976/g.15633 Transcript_4976/m.15633 type:complete len:107 (+) Transcript_4976:36-356(+)
MKSVFVLSLVLGAASAFRAAVPPTARNVVSSSSPTALRFFNRDGEPSEAERARIDAEQEALNAKWAKESQNELILMSVFGIGTALPVLYLLSIALSDDGGGGTGVY